MQQVMKCCYQYNY